VYRRGLLAAGGGLAAAELLGAQGAEAFTLKREEKQVVDIFEKATLGVVHVVTERVVMQRRGEELIPSTTANTGTGWLFDNQGHIATNLHVLGGGDSVSKVTVAFADGSMSQASVVGVDAGTDVAVLKVDEIPKLAAAACRPIARASSGDVRVGQDVYAIGFPFGTDRQTFTRGIVSGLGRTVPSSIDGRPIAGMIQTDAGLNPGNSGGPLLNSDGEVVGMNTQILSSTGASVGIGMAVPSDTVSARVASILKYGRVRRPTLGVLFGPDTVTKSITSGQGGGIVMGFQRNSPAEAAGMQTSDIILAVNQQRVKGVNDVYAMQDSHEPGETVTVTALRPSIAAPEQGVKLQPVVFSVTLAEAETSPKAEDVPPDQLKAAAALSKVAQAALS
jgi:S1-C subfamily serine protease